MKPREFLHRYRVYIFLATLVVWVILIWIIRSSGVDFFTTELKKCQERCKPSTGVLVTKQENQAGPSWRRYYKYPECVCKK